MDHELAGEMTRERDGEEASAGVDVVRDWFEGTGRKADNGQNVAMSAGSGMGQERC